MGDIEELKSNNSENSKSEGFIITFEERMKGLGWNKVLFSEKKDTYYTTKNNLFIY